MPQRARIALFGALALVALLILTWFAAIHIPLVQRADLAVLRGFGGIGTHPHVSAVASFIAGLCNPNPYVYLCVIPVAIALGRRRPRVALAIVAILIGANFATELLKPLLAAQRPFVPNRSVPVLPGSWPSGHATAAMSLALCCVLAAPARARPYAAALGAAFAVAVSYSFLALEWHYPSDVLGGFLVAGAWTLLGVAAVFALDAHRGARVAYGQRQRLSVRAALGPPSLVMLGGLGLALLVAFARPHQVVAFAGAHELFLLGAASIGALGLALATGVMLTLRR
jgi:membrane-associated phospholipid phosphatase